MNLDEHRKLSALIEKIGRTDDLSTPPRVEAALLGELRRRRHRSIALRVAVPLALAAAVLIALLTAPKPELKRPDPVAIVTPPVPQSVEEPAVAPKPRIVRARRAAPGRPGRTFTGLWRAAGSD
mgnify:CR=1 FL=1